MEAAKVLPPSYTGKSGIYCSYPGAYEARAKEYASFLFENGKNVSYEESTRALAECESLLVFLAQDTDLSQARQDITYALDLGKHIVCVLIGEVTLDNGLDIQLGLAPKIVDSSEALAQVLSALQIKEKSKNPSKKRLILLFFAFLAAAFLLLIFLPGREKSVESTVPAEDHIPMENALRDGLIKNGIDISGDGGISKEELETAQVLDLSSLGITDISPLAAASNVVQLDLSGNLISDITPLAGMSKLERVDLSANAIEDFQVLDYLPALIEQNVFDQRLP